MPHTFDYSDPAHIQAETDQGAAFSRYMMDNPQPVTVTVNRGAGCLARLFSYVIGVGMMALLSGILALGGLEFIGYFLFVMLLLYGPFYVAGVAMDGLNL